jgi:hypothetical protein
MIKSDEAMNVKMNSCQQPSFLLLVSLACLFQICSFFFFQVLFLRAFPSEVFQPRSLASGRSLCLFVWLDASGLIIDGFVVQQSAGSFGSEIRA